VALRRAQVRAAEEDVELKVSEAYWGVKLARELLLTIREGKKHLDKARKKIEEDLDNDEGDATVTDLLRLKTFGAEIDAREAEAQKLEDIAAAGVAALTRLKPGTFDLDPTPLALVAGEPAPVQAYLDLARQHRPEVELLNWATRAREAGKDLEQAKFFPDFLLVGTLGYGTASPVDDPHNAFLNDPFNFLRAGFGLALRWNLDTVQQVGRYRAAKAKSLETASKREEGLAGVEFEIRKEWLSLAEAAKRLDATRRGEKAARSWLVATAQNLEAGLAESKDLTDALLAFFQLRVRYLQAIFDVNVGWARLGRSVGKKAPPRS
jgi:outer membrane protein TolC